MSTKIKNAATKNSEIKNSEIKKTENLKKVNLDKFAKQFENYEVKEKSSRETIYVYPEGFTKEKINSLEGKKFRNNLRSKMQRFANNIFAFCKTKNAEKLENEIQLFLIEYKTFYKLNDFTVKSISQGSNDSKNKNLTDMLEVVKQFI